MLHRHWETAFALGKAVPGTVQCSSETAGRMLARVHTCIYIHGHSYYCILDQQASIARSFVASRIPRRKLLYVGQVTDSDAVCVHVLHFVSRTGWRSSGQHVNSMMRTTVVSDDADGERAPLLSLPADVWRQHLWPALDPASRAALNATGKVGTTAVALKCFETAASV